MRAINTRKDLFMHLEKTMTHSYDKLKEKGTLDPNLNMVKSYIVESNIKATELHSLKKIDFKIHRAQDKSLFIVEIKKKEHRFEVFIDTSNERFWSIHSVDRTEFVDDFLKKSINSIMSGLDHPWLPNQFLTKLGQDTIFRGFGLAYDNVFDENPEETSASIQKISMRLWGTSAPNVLDVLKKDKNLKNSITLSSVGIKHYLDEEENLFSIDDITYWGKFTTRGTSLDGHLEKVREVTSDYSENIKLIEDNSLEYVRKRDGFKLNGSVATIDFDKEIENLDAFTDSLLSSKKPFRLWGIKNKLSDDFIRANTIDLHTGGKLNLEISNDWMRIYLPHDSCGNTIMRLFTNIQKHYDSETSLELGEYGAII